MNEFSTLEILDWNFSIVVRGVSRVLGENCKSASAELFVFALGGPAAPTRVKGRTDGSSAQGIRVAFEVGLRLGLGLWLGL